MAWDKDVPAGSTKVSASDDLIRANQAAIETAVDQEHAFATGGTQTGRHSFDRDTEANRDAASPAYENGGIFFATDVRSGYHVLQVKDSGTFENVDVNPVDGSSLPTLPRVNAQSRFTVAQFGKWEALTISSGNVAVDLSKSARRSLTLTEDVTFTNPTNTIADHATSILVDLSQDGTGGRTISWGSAYRSVTGSVQIATGASEKTLISIQSMTGGIYIVTTIPDWNNSIT